MKTLVLAMAVVFAACSSTPHGATTSARESNGRYRVPSEVGTLVVDDAAFAAFVAEVRPDLERDVTSKDVEVVKARQFVLAMLDALDGKLPAAIQRVDAVAALETKPEIKAMTGLTVRAWADANGDEGQFRAAFAARIDALPKQQLEAELAMLRTMGKLFTPDVCRKLVNEEVTPQVKDGTVGVDQVHSIVFARYAVVKLVPVGTEIDAVLAAAGVPTVEPE